ncbi:PREDICTED: 39S ribosomal protein L21, mitochondrial [Nicrophorus vespilloides]|uniref:Large ribosomal subunit protein bL21m n=1 Tax=Nicrophorus vespilloides TaxID=110193 RepID=A0ABM1N8I9_NICVS|nr:PREDICTED: 39S ribosomal protein L21, mitochondrial [Nicrophorus vespilloides]
MSLLRQFCSKLAPILVNNSVRSTQNVSAAITTNRFFSNKPAPYEIVDPKIEKQEQQDIIKKVNEQVNANQQGRIFAVVHLAGKQFKITEGDVIVVEGYWPPGPGDKLKLDKVLMVGAKDFTLIGRPIVEDGLANVTATVIEKTLSHTKTDFKKKRRKQYKNINFYRIQQTMLRINTIDLSGKLNNPPDVTGTEHRIL